MHVFITARYRPNIIFAARASTATSLVLCLSALVALTRATLTSPRTLTYLLTYLLHQRNLFRSREISGLTFLWFFARIIAESGHRANFRSEEREKEDFKHERTRSEKKGDARIELVEGSVRWLNVEDDRLLLSVCRAKWNALQRVTSWLRTQKIIRPYFNTHHA